MQVTLELGARQGDIAAAGGPAVVVNLFAGTKRPGGATKVLDQATDGLISRAIETGVFTGAKGDILVLTPDAKTGPERLLVLGLGSKDDFDLAAAREVAGKLVQKLNGLKVEQAVTVLHGGGSGKGIEDLAQALAEGAVTGAYSFDDYITDGRAKPRTLTRLTVMESQAKKVTQIRRGLTAGTRVGHAVNQARHLADGPANEVTPSHLVKTARALGREFGFSVKALGQAQCEKLGMGAFLGVARGSDEPCQFIVMEYEPKQKSRGTVCFVGKGITFDSGGISIKPGQDMDQMKYDMSGAAAVIGAMRYVAEAKVPVKVVGLVAATENLPGGKAYKPGDILTSMSGTTIEVLNTDAEGRLVLADALSYAERYEPDAVIDLATLTGACVIALGEYASGLFSNDEWMLDAVHKASVDSGDAAWPMPLWSEYRRMVESKVADIKNTAGRTAGAITAAAFLGAFTNKYRWAHLDIAGTAWHPLGTGAGVRTLARFVDTWKQPKGDGPKPGPRTSLRRTAADKADK